jgi:hypothetical protein
MSYVGFPNDLGSTHVAHFCEINATRERSSSCERTTRRAKARSLSGSQTCHSITRSACRRRDADAERVCGLAIDYQFEDRRLFDRQIAGFRALENAVGVVGRAPPRLTEIWTIGDKASCKRIIVPPGNQRILFCKANSAIRSRPARVTGSGADFTYSRTFTDRQSPSTTPAGTTSNKPYNEQEHNCTDRGVDDCADDADAKMNAQLW